MELNIIIEDGEWEKTSAFDVIRVLIVTCARSLTVLQDTFGGFQICR